MLIKKSKQQELLIKDIITLSKLVKKLSLYSSFVSKSKKLDLNYINFEIQKIKSNIKDIEKYL